MEENEQKLNADASNKSWTNSTKIILLPSKVTTWDSPTNHTPSQDIFSEYPPGTVKTCKKPLTSGLQDTKRDPVVVSHPISSKCYQNVLFMCWRGRQW